MKKSIIDFLKKNALLFIAILIAIGAILFSYGKQRQVATLTAKLTDLQYTYNLIEKDRKLLLVERDSLEKVNTRIQKEKDSIKLVQARQKAYYDYIIKKHKKEIDSLLNVPNDTIYMRLQPIYPNPAQEPLLYPFSGTQIRSIYSTALSYPRLQNEYGLQASLLGTCNDLNKKYELSENNYKLQIDNLNKDIKAADDQIGIRDKELKITQKQLKHKTFWNWSFKAAIVAVGAYAILK